MHVDHHRDAIGATHFTDEFHDLDRGLGVQGRRRLVGQQELGLLHEGAGNADALALAARKAVGTLVGESGEAHRVEERKSAVDVGPRVFPQPGFPRRDIAQPSAKQVFHHREALNEVVFLKHHADLAARQAQRAPVQFHQVLILEEDLAGSRLDQPVDAADQRRLAGARGADDGRDSGATDIQGDATQNGFAARVFLVEVADRQCSRRIVHFLPAASARAFSFSNADAVNAWPLSCATLRTPSQSFL